MVLQPVEKVIREVTDVFKLVDDSLRSLCFELRQCFDQASCAPGVRIGSVVSCRTSRTNSDGSCTQFVGQFIDPLERPLWHLNVGLHHIPVTIVRVHTHTSWYSDGTQRTIAYSSLTRI